MKTLLAILLAALPGLAQDASVTLNGAPATSGDYPSASVSALTLNNGLLSITFGPDGGATSLIKNGKELIHNLSGLEGRDSHAHRSWYIDYNAGRGGLVADTIRVVKVTPEMAHVAIIDSGKTSAFYLEHHILLAKGESGVYGYVICRNIKNSRVGGEMRSMYRLDRDIFDWAYVSERTGQQLRYAELIKYPQVQDETWQLPDGTVYQKYDYSGYIAENPMWGHYGHGFGVWFMPVSTEYYAGGPLRQDLMVHQDALILNYFQGAHYGGGGSDNFANGEKLFGPWFTYVNTGAPAEMIQDARKKAAAEQAGWPYQWMNEPLYPMQRTRVSGQLHVDGRGSAAHATVVLAKAGQEIYRQGGDFMFYASADASGRFVLPHVRPGTYSLYAYATEGSLTNQMVIDAVDVKGPSLNMGEVHWAAPGYKDLLWQVGKADRMSGEFKYGDQLRNIKWIGMVPADLTYTVGESHDRDGWYFAQGKVGNWNVVFTNAKTRVGNARLTIAIAGVSNNPHLTVSLNGVELKSMTYGNDAATYRAALRSARYQVEEITFPASLLKQGENTVRLNLTQVGKNGGIMYDTIKLEAD